MSSRAIADRTFVSDPVLESGTACAWPAPLTFGEPGDPIAVDWGTADVVLARYCGLGLSGTLRIDGEPGVRIYLHDGLVYFAEHTTDTELGFRLVLDGLITEDQLVRGSRLLERGRHLGQMFWNDPTIDSRLVVDGVVGYCTDTVHSLAGLTVTTHAFLPDEHHSSGILAWYTGAADVATSSPVVPAEMEVEVVELEAVEVEVEAEPVEAVVLEAVEVEPVVLEVLAEVEVTVVEVTVEVAVEPVEIDVLEVVELEVLEAVEVEAEPVEALVLEAVVVEPVVIEVLDEVDVLEAVVLEPVVVEVEVLEALVVEPVDVEVEPVQLEAVAVEAVLTDAPADELEMVFTTMLDWLGPVELEPLVDFDDDYRSPVVAIPRLPRRSRHDESAPVPVSANLDNSGMGSVDISVLQTALTNIRASSSTTATMTSREIAPPAVPADTEVAGEKVLGSPAERRRWMARRHR